jgi:hypothetical protein
MPLPPAAMLHYCTIPLRSETDVPSKLPKFLGRASTIPVKPTVTQGNATDVFNPPDHHIEGRGRISVRLRYEMMVVCDHIVAAVCNNSNVRVCAHVLLSEMSLPPEIVAAGSGSSLPEGSSTTSLSLGHDMARTR